MLFGKSLRIVAAVALLGLIVAAGFHLWQFAVIGSAYKAKILCSGVFIAKRTPVSILNEDLAVFTLTKEVRESDLKEKGQICSKQIQTETLFFTI